MDDFLKKVSLKSTGLLILCFSFWWVMEFRLHPAVQGSIDKVRVFALPSCPVFSSHLLHMLPMVVFLMLFLLFLVKVDWLKKPYLFESWSGVLKEGFVWGLAACLFVVPVALGLGYKLGFEFHLEKAVGDVFSNTYEELVYRLFLFWVVKEYTNSKALGVLVSAFIFAYTHKQYPLQLQAVVFTAGLCFSMSYIRTRNITAPIFAHMVADLVLDTILVG